MIVAELAAKFGWDVDFDTIARYQSALNKAIDRTEELAAQSKILNAMQAVEGNPALAMATIAPGAGPGKGDDEKDKEAKTSRWAKALEVTNDALGVATKGYAILTGGVNRLRGMFDDAAAAAARANDTAARTGLSVEAVQELGFAASQSGADIDTLAGGLKALSDKADSASKGGQDAARALRQVGLSGKDIKSGQVPLDAALGQIADRFAALPDGARKSALAVDLFGGAGVKLIPFLNKGSEGIGALRAEAQRLGVVMSGDTTQAMADLGDQQNKLGAQLTGIRNQVLAALLPMLSELAAGLSVWLERNRETIIEVITTIGTVVMTVIRVVGAVVRAVVTAVSWIVENWKLVTAAVLALAGPIGWIALAIWGLVEAWPYIVDAATAAGDAIADAFVAAGRAIMSAFRAVGRAFAAVWSGIKSAASAIGRFFTAVGSTIKSAFQAVINFFIDGVNNVIGLINKAISAANKLPWVDMGKIGTIDRVGGDPRTAATAGGSSTVNVDVGGIQVTSSAADGEAVAQHVRRAFADQLGQTLRETDAAIPPGIA